VNQKNLAVATVAIVVAIVVGAIVWHFAAPSHRVESASQPPALGQAAIGTVAPEFVLPTTGGLFDMQNSAQTGMCGSICDVVPALPAYDDRHRPALQRV
jgi:hypothetical protein